MHTSVALERKDFNDFNVQEGLHIGIIVKDFRAIVAHAETMKAQVTSRYSRGNRPMQFTYESNGVRAEFTLMTRGIAGNIPSDRAASTPARDLSVRPVSQSAQTPGTASIPATTQNADMPPPVTRTSFRTAAPPPPALNKGGSTDSAPAPSASIDPDSLFIPADNDDQQWDEPNYDEEPDIVTWDNTSDNMATSMSTRRIRDSEPTSFATGAQMHSETIQGIAPTQRLSQVRGALFD